MTAQPIPTQPAEPEATTYCCELAEFGDWCSCAADLAELAAAFSAPIFIDAQAMNS